MVKWSAFFLASALVLVGCASTAPAPIASPPITSPENAPAPEEERQTPGTPSPDFPRIAETSLSDLSTNEFSNLPGWADANPILALTAFQRSCAAFTRAGDKGVVWEHVCEKALSTDVEKDAARTYFETYFIPQEQSTIDGQGGLLTAYYEPELEVRTAPAPGFDEPIYARPEDLVTVDPKKFKATGFRGRKLMGRVDEGQLVPYYTRNKIIEMGGKALAWGRAADVFFLQVQGSGRLHFNDGRTMRAAFAGHNGHTYTSIGRVLIKSGELASGKASKGAIERWMKTAGPEKARGLMNNNQRYVFFAAQTIKDEALGPVGTQGVPLTAGASLAVDPGLYSMGTPIWVDTRLPKNGKDWKGQPTQFLAIAQDTGGAIKGPVRGDLFIGSGAKAGRRAGIVKHPARWWVLVPRALVAGTAGSQS